MHTVTYNCSFVLSEYPHLTTPILFLLETKLNDEDYNYYYEDGKLKIRGDFYVSSDTTAEEVANDLKWLLLDVADIDADVSAETQYDDDDYPASVGVGSYHYAANSNWRTW